MDFLAIDNVWVILNKIQLSFYNTKYLYITYYCSSRQ